MPFFDFFEPPSMREPAVPREAMSRDVVIAREVANMSKAELREYYLEHKDFYKTKDNDMPMSEEDIRDYYVSHQELKELEIQLATRSSYRRSEISLMTNTSEIVSSLSHLSPAELSNIVKSEIAIAKKLNDYSNLDAKYIEVAAQMSKGKIKYIQSEPINDFEFRNNPERLNLELKIENIELPNNIKEIIITKNGNPEQVVAYEFDSEGDLVWIEQGKGYFDINKGSKENISGSGLSHSWLEHKNNFRDIGINSEKELIEMFNEAVRNGDKTNNRGGGYKYSININTSRKLVFATGPNGFVITAFPDKIIIN